MWGLIVLSQEWLNLMWVPSPQLRSQKSLLLLFHSTSTFYSCSPCSPLTLSLEEKKKGENKSILIDISFLFSAVVIFFLFSVFFFIFPVGFVCRMPGLILIFSALQWQWLLRSEVSCLLLCVCVCLREREGKWEWDKGNDGDNEHGGMQGTRLCGVVHTKKWPCLLTFVCTLTLACSQVYSYNVKVKFGVKRNVVIC